MSIVIVEHIRLDTAEEVSIRNLISEWSNRIPHHNLQDFGDKIHISEIIYCPIYEIIFRTQYFSRTTIEKSRPNDGTSRDKGIPNTGTDIELGNFAKKTITEVEYKSEYIVTCSACNGKGRVTCWNCSGVGRATCSRCSGQGRRDCYSCNGRGSSSCFSCGGSGSNYTSVSEWRNGRYENTYRNVRCSSCSGSGRRSCSGCGSSGRVQCDNCYGSGIATCGTCNGLGTTTCSGCSGYGSLVYYTEQTRKWDYRVSRKLIYNHELHTNNFPEFNVNDNLDRNQIDYLLADVIDPRKYASEPAYFEETFLEQTDQSKSFKGIRVESNGKILFQDVNVNDISAHVVTCSFNNDIFNLLILKYSNTLYDNHGPIAKIRHQFRDEGKKYSKKKNWGESVKLIRKGKEMDPDAFDPMLTKLHAKVTGKIKSSYWLGFFICIFLAGYFSLSFYIDAIQNENHLLSGWFIGQLKTHEVIISHVVGYTIFFLLITFVQANYVVTRLYKRWDIKLSPEIKRVCVGFLFGIISAVISTIIVCLLDKTGIIYNIGAFIYNII